MNIGGIGKQQEFQPDKPSTTPVKQAKAVAIKAIKTKKTGKVNVGQPAPSIAKY
jgi:hypothetical protein